MSKITKRDVHVDAALTNLAIGYHPSMFVAEEAIAVVPVKKESDKYYVWDKQSAFQDYEALRADGARSNLVDFGLSTATYSANEYALSTKVTDRQKDNADSVLRLRESKMRRVQDLLILAQERRVSTLLTTGANYATGHTSTPSTKWDASGNTIRADVDSARNTVRQAIGRLPNKIIIPFEPAQVIARDSNVLELIKYTDPTLLVGGTLPPVLWGMKVLIPGSTYTSSLEGASTVTYTDVWSDNVVLIWDAGEATIDSPHFAKIFRSKDWNVSTWREDAEKAEYIEPSQIQDEVITSNSSGYLYTDVLT